MLRALRVTLVATVVGVLTTVGVFAAAVPAQAAEPVDSRYTLLDGLRDVVMSPSSAVDVIVGDLNQDGTLDTQEPDYSAMPWMATLLAKTGGTPSQVQSGEKLASRACRTGVGCLLTLGAMVGLGAYATSDVWGPWLESASGPLADVDPSFYPQTPTHPCADPTDVHTMTTPLMQFTFTQVAGYFAPGCYPADYGVAYDCVANGTWAHGQGTMQHNAATPQSANPGTYTLQLGNVCSSLTGSPGAELRRVHFFGGNRDWAQGRGTEGWKRGFYWGQNIIPEDGSIESLTRCSRSDGSTYDRVVVEPVATGLSALPACNAGDTPVYTQQTLIGTDGSREVQSSQRYASPAFGNEVFSSCSTAGCKWVVKVDGVPCSVGNAACVDWASDKNSATCWYGPYQLPLSQCYWLERAYEDQTAIPATKWNTDGDPLTADGPSRILTPTSNPTPTASPSTTTSTSPSPTTSPSTGPLPTASPSPDPSASPSPSSEPSSSPSSTTSASPSPSPSSTSSTPAEPPPPRVGCETKYNLGPVQPEAVKVANQVGDLFALDVIGGYRESNDQFGEHSSGRALDFMTYSDTAKGQAIADYLKANAATLGVNWVIWDQHIWNAERASEGWRLMADRGDPTQNHKDHVHTFLFDTDGESLSCSGDPLDDGAGGDSCWPSGWGWFNPAEWVLKPIKCALSWGFVPKRDQLQANFAKVRTSWAASPVAIYAAEVALYADALSIDQGTCQGPGIHLPGPLANGRVVYPGNACAGFQATLAEILRTLLGGSFVVGGIIACVRFLASGFNYSGFDNINGGSV